MKLHGYARLPPHQRELLGRRVDEEGWTVAQAAKAAGCSERTGWMLDGLRLTDPAWCVAPSFSGELVDVLTAAFTHGLEGVIVKRSASRYQPGKRSGQWVKVKVPEWREAHGAGRRPGR